MVNNAKIHAETSEELRKHIEFLRKELISVGLKYGLNSNEAVVLSQELDNYLAICQKCCPPECHQQTIKFC